MFNSTYIKMKVSVCLVSNLCLSSTDMSLFVSQEYLNNLWLFNRKVHKLIPGLKNVYIKTQLKVFKNIFPSGKSKVYMFMLQKIYYAGKVDQGKVQASGMNNIYFPLLNNIYYKYIVFIFN